MKFEEDKKDWEIKIDGTKVEKPFEEAVKEALTNQAGIKELFIIEELKPFFDYNEKTNTATLKDFMKVRLAEIEDYKQKEYHISEDEMNDLIVKGVVETSDGLKLDATLVTDLWKSAELFHKFKGEHILLNTYKQKVKEVIHKYCSSQLMLHNLETEMFKELGLE